MIAIHTALYIFRPRSSGREGGLFPYRHIAYTLWIILPILSASLAFINQQGGYVLTGTYCYLPVRPFWYRLALSWIPRYLIFIVILGIYASIYYYVRYKFNDFSNNGEGTNPGTCNTESSAGQRVRSTKRAIVPPTPTLVSHGLIPKSRQSSVIDNGPRKQSVSTVGSSGPPKRVGAHRFIWGSFSVDNGAFPSRPPSEPANIDADSFTGPSTPFPLPPTSAHTITPRPQGSDDSNTAVASRATSWRDAFVRRFSPDMSGNPSNKPSIVEIFAILRHHPDSSNNSTPISQLRLVNSRGQTFAAAEMLRTRDKIRRQLRFLFIYPLVYIGMWILPFVSHVLQYDDKFAANPPFGLTLVTTVCICSQAAVDCWLFSTREKPWRQIPGTDGSFWASLKFWSGWEGLGQRSMDHGPGKSREEMVREARAAYQRRDVELAQQRNATDSIGEGPGRGERSWWEVAGVDGTTSPMSEEVSDPMEEHEGISPSSKEMPPKYTKSRDSTTESEGGDSEATSHTVVYRSPAIIETGHDQST
jgi:G protein-coupled receptor GPR1